MTETNGVKLTIKETRGEDIGRRMATLPWQVRGRLNISSGDIVNTGMG